MASKQDKWECREHPHEGRLPSESASRPRGKIEEPACAVRKQRRLAEFKQGCRYGQFGKTKAYELIAQRRIRAYKMGGKTMIDLDSVDQFHASLPRVESRAS